ncbi:MAG: element excision factor XisH family protein [Cyanobacteriota bacterium]
MPRLDFIHNAVRNALIKDGWSVTDDQSMSVFVMGSFGSKRIGRKKE